MPRLSYENIQKQIQKLQEQAKKLEATRDAQKTRAITQVTSLMRRLSLTVDDLKQSSSKPIKKSTSGTKKKGTSAKERPPVPPKYRDEQTGNTWTGRGKPPRWLQEKIHLGRQKEDFLIHTATAHLSAEPEHGADNGDRTRI